MSKALLYGTFSFSAICAAARRVRQLANANPNAVIANSSPSVAVTGLRASSSTV